MFEFWVPDQKKNGGGKDGGDLGPRLNKKTAAANLQGTR